VSLHALHVPCSKKISVFGRPPLRLFTDFRPDTPFGLRALLSYFIPYIVDNKFAKPDIISTMDYARQVDMSKIVEFIPIG
jgi:hypothetical protein